MKLDIKYNLDDEVYAVYKEDDGVVRLFKDKIVEFAISKEHGLHYFLENSGEDFKEEELILVDQQDSLIERINKLLED